MNVIIEAISTQVAQVAYPLMSGCAIFWAIIYFVDWWKNSGPEKLTRSIFLFMVFLQFNWLVVLAGMPWLISDMTPFRPYIRLGWSIVAFTWLVHTVVFLVYTEWSREALYNLMEDAQRMIDTDAGVKNADR